IEGEVIARTNWVIPIPGRQCIAARMISGQHLREAFRLALRLLKHSELVPRYRLILVDTGFDVPACKIAAVRPGKRSCSKTAYGSALPIPVVDMARIESRLLPAGTLHGFANSSFPGSLRNFVPGTRRGARRTDNHEQAETSGPSKVHGTSTKR